MNKIIFLKQSKAPLKVIFYFLIQKVKNIFVKSKIKKFKKNHKQFLKDKKITNDYFSMNSFNFYRYLSKIDKNFFYLELGSYEGNSAIFIADNFKESKIFCVDHWIGVEEYKEKNFNIIEENFDFNTKLYSNILKIKKTSDEFFSENQNLEFHVIYVDGNHKGDQVFKDCINSWKVLKENGLLICDDYIWSFYEKTENNPCYSINLFLKKIKNEYKILQVSNSQIFIKKIAKST